MTATPDTTAVHLEVVADAAVVTPDGPIMAGVVDGLRRRLGEAVASGRHVVVDMAHASTIDPDGLAVLVRGHCDAKQHGRALCLVAPSRFVLTAVRTMRLLPVFPVFPDRRTALLWLATERQQPVRRDPSPRRSDARRR